MKKFTLLFLLLFSGSAYSTDLLQNKADGDIWYASDANSILNHLDGVLYPISPTTRNKYDASADFGSNTYRWRNLYLSGTGYFSTGIGIATSAPDRPLEINSTYGTNMRLTYNDADGSAANYVDLNCNSSGGMQIAPSGGSTFVSGDIRVNTNRVLINVNSGEVQAESFLADGGDEAFITAQGTSRFGQIGVLKNTGINGCGQIMLTSEGGTNYYLWVDNSGDFRISTDSTHVGTASGTKVGSQ